MGRDEKTWHPRFINYMKMIATSPRYRGLPITQKEDGSYNWIATAKSDIGQRRIAWCIEKAKELNIPIQPGVYADVMLEIHPTKWKPCQICGREMSLYYHYPNANFLKSLNETFNSDFTMCDHISDIWDELISQGVSSTKIASFLIKKGSLTLKATSPKEEIIRELEYACRKGNKKCLGPGAMSNFPDRYDGFHTYNRCCRSTQDKGRSKMNLKSYTKDRRAYEYWSDGNIHAANQFMGSAYFEGTSADHIGPISLGFVHDPRYLQKMSSSDNSSKRDRLLIEDVDKIIQTYTRTGIYPMSWQSQLLWEFIKEHYHTSPEKVSTTYRDALKQNMADFMFILWTILNNCGNNGEEFLIEAFLAPHYHFFEYSYTFNELGEIVSQTPRHYTERNADELIRYNRIAINSVYDYNEKENRHITSDLTRAESLDLAKICKKIGHSETDSIKNEIVELVETIERRLISNL